ncbi:MAG: phage tail length tape measure family protein, partial [Hyphomonas sp.]
MNAPAPFRFSMVLTADASQAKAALQDVQGAVTKATAETGRANQSAREQAGALDAMAAAAARAALQTGDLAAAEARAIEARRRAQIGPLNVLAQPAALPSATPAAAFRATDTAAVSLRDTMAGMGQTIRASVDDMMLAAGEARDYRAALDEVRASFNPLFAASRRYELELDRIASAERMGAVNAMEAAQARRRAASIIAPAGQAPQTGPSGPNNFATANIAAQFNDIGVTAAMGMSPIQIALQQGTQLSQVFNQMGGGKEVLGGLRAGFLSMINPVSLATIGVIAFGAAGLQWLGSLRTETKSLEEALTGLEGSVDAYSTSSERARMTSSALRAEFGGVSDMARRLLGDMAELDRLQANRDIASSISAMSRNFGVQLDDYAVPGASDLKGIFGASGFDREEMSMIFGLESALKWANDAKGIEQQIRAVETLKDRWIETSIVMSEAGDAERMEAGQQQIGTLLERLAQLQALQNNDAGREAAGQMTRERQRQVELARTELRFGRDSAEVRAVEARHAQEAVAERIEALGLTQADVEARRLLAAVAAEFALREALAAKARQDAQDTYLRRQSDQIAAVQLETRLLGATTAERQRAKILAEAEIEIRERELGLLEAAAVRRSAIARADADAALARQRAIRDLQLRGSADILDLQIGAARDPITRANLQGQQEYARQIAAGADADLAAAQAAQVRAKSLAEALQASQGQAAAMTEEVAIR